MAQDAAQADGAVPPCVGHSDVWGDVTPLPQNEGDTPPVFICCSADFNSLMSYLRPLMQRNELSHRALDLTAKVIDVNYANYAVWEYRRNILFGLNEDALFVKEREWLNEVGPSHPKNYQIWYHRRMVVHRLGNADDETTFVDGILFEDNKNYHAWSFRQWLVRHFGLWAQELVSVEAMVDRDWRNNSAWNMRFFLAMNAPAGSVGDEVGFAWKYIRKCPNNQPPWCYLKGLLAHGKGNIEQAKRDIQEFRTKFPYCAHATSLLASLLQEEASPASLATAVELCVELETKTNEEHGPYWANRKAELMRLIERPTVV